MGAKIVYAYKCESCGASFDIVKPVSQYDADENCQCGYLATRIPFPQKIHLGRTAVESPYFNHALGQVCTDSEARKIAKERGLIEVGNEKVEKHVKVEESTYDDVWKGA